MSWVTIPGLWASYPTSLSFNFLFHEMGVMAVPSHTIVVKIEQGNPTELRGGLDVKREPLGRLPRKREEMLLTEFHVTAARGRGGVWESQQGLQGQEVQLGGGPGGGACVGCSVPPAFRGELHCPLVAEGCDLTAAPTPRCPGAVPTTSVSRLASFPRCPLSSALLTRGRLHF